MTASQIGIITLLKSAVIGQPLPLPEAFDPEAAYPQLKRHHIQTLAYVGAVTCGISRQLPVMGTLFRDYCKAMMISEGQMTAVKRLCDALEAEQIDYMPLKGCNMKPRYPKPELRVMGDADILIPVEQYDRIVPILEAQGFTPVVESDHELIWRSKGLLLELHKRLIPSYNKDFYAAMGDGWQLATVRNGHRLSMSPEDELFYLFTHFAKHYRDGGIGLGHVTDLWVFLRACPQVDEQLVKQKLEPLGLRVFYENIRQLLDVWFADAVWDEKTEFITDFVFDSGRWGTAEEHVLSTAVKDSKSAIPGATGRLTYLWKRAFPSAEDLCEQYTVLKKAPWLVGAVWVVRPLEKVLFDRKAIAYHKKRLRLLRQDRIQTRQDALRYVGLDYHFE